MINSSSFLNGFYFEQLLTGRLCVLEFDIELLRVSQKGISQRTFSLTYNFFILFYYSYYWHLIQGVYSCLVPRLWIHDPEQVQADNKDE